jgi:hypothetical protein
MKPEQLEEMLAIANAIEAQANREASRRNSAYDVYGWDNTAEKVNPLGMRAVQALRKAHKELSK